ncbi:nuclease-related domain-containing protein (plasmid) [Acuticoccus sp. MNP-M23]|uniref:nuclease-related domain-containing protein n=1 Tax=Acuticoccus sp. MNP-M23 TaxID=3072793 RepID=UPI0028158E4B|nr:nuclease-related domain-containing protein [Acuticoccus sp. MNP-M23]WMS45372.1 nuclease-related domain-containing protein [Acuticoccus sp. MNP-M23]
MDDLFEKEIGSEPRSMEAIFDDLRRLAQRDGAIHEISAIVYRDWVLTIDTQDAKIVDPPEQRWATSKLNSNELMLLLGLAVQSQSDRIYSVIETEGDFAETADRLLRELHDRLLWETRLDPVHPTPPDKRQIAAVAREAIYYGAESFYINQLERYARDRFRDDFDWLLRNVGLSPGSMVQIARFILDRITAQMSGVIGMQQAGQDLTKGDLTNSLLIAKSDLAQFGDKAATFIEKFARPVAGANLAFTGPFHLNEVGLAPLIDLGECLYVPNSNRLFLSIYESPFYWMMADRSYADTHAINRGRFTERSAVGILEKIFGNRNVHRNVTIERSKKKIAGEADVLVVYGDFVIIVQAKSKRVSLKARAGDEHALYKDFQGAIQDPYRQAYEFAKLIHEGATARTAIGQTLHFTETARTYPVVVLSDAFPSTTILSDAMLEREPGIKPVIWDLGFLDAAARLLPTPIEFLFYLKCRAEMFERIHSDSEFNFLGYHLRAKLFIPDDCDFMHLDRDFASVIDDYMICADLKIPAERPLGILERIGDPAVSGLLAHLKTAPPEVASVVLDFYDFSGEGLGRIGQMIEYCRAEVSAGKLFKAFSNLTESGGFTYLVSATLDERIRVAAEALGRKHKYDQKCDRWYVIVDCIKTAKPVDRFLPLSGRWQEDADDEEFSRQVEKVFRRKEIPPELLAMTAED